MLASANADLNIVNKVSIYLIVQYIGALYYYTAGKQDSFRWGSVASS